MNINFIGQTSVSISCGPGHRGASSGASLPRRSAFPDLRAFWPSPLRVEGPLPTRWSLNLTVDVCAMF